ncbi:MAG: lytic murein transglycosylase [Deltaproteobacteria bacterium]|nr:lytic murein transglycosylase [Deltaproteobacteria bacterium]
MFKMKNLCNYLGMLCVYLSVVIFAPALVYAETIKDKTKSFESLEKRLVRDGFDKKKIAGIYNNKNVRFNLKSVSLFFMHNEANLNYNAFLAKKHIKQAKKYQQQHFETLDRVQKKFDADKNIITAIILVETKLGTNTGHSSVINTLSTMASLSDRKARNLLWKSIPADKRLLPEKFKKKALRKSRWAYKELKAFIKYTSRENIRPDTIYGSYAGAVGIAQFMPSNILSLAIDGNNDGKVDLFNHADAIFSIANYLNYSGWHPEIDKKNAFKVIYRYNHSKYYVNTILKIANSLKEKK